MSVRLEHVEVGTRVAYEDAMNPRREGRVTEILLDGREYAVAWDEREGFDSEVVTTSDLRQAGWTMLADLPGSFFDGADVIHAYTRADAISDGTLVPATDLTQDEPDFVRQAGFTVPVCLTRSVAELVVPNAREGERGQSVKGRLWDVLSMARFYARRDGDTTVFPCLFWNSRDGRGGQRKIILKAVIGPDDDGSPAITIMLRGES